MDEFNIADISSAINNIGGDKDFDILGALQHRVPVFSALSPLLPSYSENNLNQENYKNPQELRSQEKNVRFNLDRNTNNGHNLQKSIINRPVDPSGSVSSSDNSSKLDEYELPPRSKNNRAANLKKSDSDNSVSSQNDNEFISNLQYSNKNHLTSIFGYNIPISTLYFILVLVAITIVLYLLTAEKKKDKDKEREKDKERN
jgi:cbb3-type cytochrome oxidase subunit 3